MDIEDIKLILSKCRNVLPETDKEKKILIDLLIRSVVVRENGNIDVCYNFRDSNPKPGISLLSSTTSVGWSTKKISKRTGIGQLQRLYAYPLKWRP